MAVRRVFGSSVGTKLLLGVTGLLLFAYLIIHLLGNLIVFAGQETFNHYAHALAGNPLVVPAEIALLLFFVVHIYKAVTMWAANQRARPVAYAKKTWAGHTSRKSVASTTMIWTGLAILVFVIIHVAHIKYGAWYDIGEPPVRDLYRTEVEVFSSPVWVAVYVIAMVLVGFHLRHGFSSAFQSLGASHPTYTRRLVVLGTIVAIVIAGGFAIIPIWVYLTR
ncbi:MAG TPA: succinate dehydrogenase cytochrome b subunit [Vicinamibacterales bacterium]|nr:succinate dehydrogenase cytochrome b subunit [Vicinamibacterales bacterium]